MSNKFYLLLFLSSSAFLVSAMEPVGVNTSDGKRIILLSKFVTESEVLMNTLISDPQKGIMAKVDMPLRKFQYTVVPYLKIGCDVTALQKKLQRFLEQAESVERQRDVTSTQTQLKWAETKLTLVISKYADYKILACLEAAEALQITSVLPVALAVAQSRRLLRNESNKSKRRLRKSY